MAGCCPPDSWPACQKPDEYKPKGTETKIGELPVYTVGTGDKAILVLPDIFGWSSNARLQAFQEFSETDTLGFHHSSSGVLKM